MLIRFEQELLREHVIFLRHSPSHPNPMRPDGLEEPEEAEALHAKHHVKRAAHTIRPAFGPAHVEHTRFLELAPLCGREMLAERVYRWSATGSHACPFHW